MASIVNCCESKKQEEKEKIDMLLNKVDTLEKLIYAFTNKLA